MLLEIRIPRVEVTKDSLKVAITIGIPWILWVVYCQNMDWPLVEIVVISTKVATFSFLIETFLVELSSD